QHAVEDLVDDPCSGIAKPIDPSSPLGKACGGAVNNRAFGTNYLRTTGGNPTLKPETATILTAGLVFEPRFVRNLSLTADYFSIVLPNTISPTGVDTILQGCYPQSAGVAHRLCDLIMRDPNTHL